MVLVSRHLRRGHQVTVYNRTPCQSGASSCHGAVAETPKAVAQQSQITFTMVGYPRDVEEVWLSTGGFAGAIE